MPVSELSTGYPQGDCSTYVHIQGKLAQSFNYNDLCKQGVTDWLTENYFYEEARKIENCGLQAVSLECPNGHQKRVRVTCHREYCPRCGIVDSLAHRKRYTRALDRLLWAPTLGYMVFTLPKEVSQAMPEKKVLSELERKSWDLVKDNFETEGGLVRIHFMGEQPEHLHIHTNVLFPLTNTTSTGKVGQAVLDKIRQEWTEFVNKTFDLNCEKTNVFYKFNTSEIRKRHEIKYVTRPVVTAEKFLTLSDEARHYIMTLHRWHNSRWYGQLANAKYKAFLISRGMDIDKKREEDIALAKKCPACGEAFKFKEIDDVNNIVKSQFRQIDNDVWVDLAIYAALKDEENP